LTRNQLTRSEKREFTAKVWVIIEDNHSTTNTHTQGKGKKKKGRRKREKEKRKRERDFI